MKEKDLSNMNYTLTLELITLILAIAWVIELIHELMTVNRDHNSEALAQKTLELIASDRERTRAGVYKVRGN